MMIEKLYQDYINCGGLVSTDTRTITPGALFFALRGDKFDANTMVKQALDAGAAHVVTSNSAYASEPRATVVADTLSALQQLASFHRGQLSIPIVGVTGTNGKTTTKELISAVLSRRYVTFATRGNLNNHIGVPLSLLSIKPDVQIAVIEMGASHPGEIRDLSALVRPTAGLITNVGIAHIEGFGSFQGVIDTKTELYAQLRSTNGTIFVNAANQHLAPLLSGYDHIFSYGPDEVPCLVSGSAEKGGETLAFHWSYNGSQPVSVQTHLTGAYNLENALAAAAVGTFFDVPQQETCYAISNYVPTNSRSQIVQTTRNKVFLDAYNANPSSMDASLTNFDAIDAPSKAVILGKMGELGAEQRPRHKDLMDRLEGMDLKRVILVGDEFREFAPSHPSFEVFSSTADAVDAVRSLKGLYVLIKGSNSNHLDRLLPEL